MLDSYGRSIEYLRLSVTQRCQQKCTYCSKSSGFCIKDSELSAERLVMIAKACAQLGFNKIRLTGGEPLLRRDICEIVTGISALKSLGDIAITTNGQLLKDCARDLKQAGLMRCNISLDSLRADKYKEITGGDLQSVLGGIHAAQSCGLDPIKLNVVLIKGKNDDEIDDFIELAKENPLEIRFIELMPLGDGGQEGINNSEILRQREWLRPDECQNSSQPAAVYSAQGFKGKIGFISPISHSFCANCNRIRVTSDGYIRPCLGSNLEYSLKEALEGTEDALKQCIVQAVTNKPKGSCFGQGFKTNRKMNRIGG